MSRNNFSSSDQIPRHIAIIMDGNGRWAQARNLPRIMGHRAGMKAVHSTVEGCDGQGVRFLTLFAFSTENWKRPADEVGALMNLLIEFLHQELDELDRKNVRIRMIGCPEDLPPPVQEEIRRAIARTADNIGLTLILALNYGSRREIASAAARYARAVQQGAENPDQVTPERFARYLETEGLPDPDLLIRTSGEYRLSNFLLWQLSYSELYVTHALWPDFDLRELEMALVAYAQRERRYGGSPHA